MNDTNAEIEARFVKLMLSSTLKMIGAMNPQINALETVRGHMLEICAGVRSRALESASDSATPEEATADVDTLVGMINEYFDYSASPLFPDVTLVKR